MIQSPICNNAIRWLVVRKSTIIVFHLADSHTDIEFLYYFCCQTKPVLRKFVVPLISCCFLKRLQRILFLEWRVPECDTYMIVVQLLRRFFSSKISGEIRVFFWFTFSAQISRYCWSILMMNSPWLFTRNGLQTAKLVFFSLCLNTFSFSFILSICLFIHEGLTPDWIDFVELLRTET